ncbi:uncharacterized protein [Onthophagus taurus]|uniref:uncharacterized protein isoform X2 n=1 Tax=Onthophagus taurus TaxID=166361 RepID=UPI000C206E32|nr:uncharacterized protein LOC111429217 isoform X2 [Onthophagus taurus]
MDNCSIESYLHKKFKKQSSSVPQQNVSAVPSSSTNEQISVSPVGAIAEKSNQCVLANQQKYIEKSLAVSDVPTNFSTNSSGDCHRTASPHTSSISVNSMSMLESRIGRPVQYSTTSNNGISLQRVSSECGNQTNQLNNQQNQINQVNQILVAASDSALNLNSTKLQSRSSSLRDEDLDKVETSSTPEKPGGKYVCNYCNLVCSKPSVLQKHIRAHTNERPFPCVSCGFSFKTRSNLYKHCRSRTHANRVLGNKAQEINVDMDEEKQESLKPDYEEIKPVDAKSKPYKPRFKAFFDSTGVENGGEVETFTPTGETTKSNTSNADLISLHIDELIHKNNSLIINTNDPNMYKKRNSINTSSEVITNNNHNEYNYKYHELYQPNHQHVHAHPQHLDIPPNEDEPLNLTNKNRKRSMSEVHEPVGQKSLIKELLLKNLYADSNKQCPHCKMIFQTVTELDLHKLRHCKGYQKAGARYSRSSSVNVASILTQNKNAFDTNPHIPNVFPLKSPGPFLGKTRLVESDKAKSFSFDDGIQTTSLQTSTTSQDIIKMSQRYALSPLTLQSEQYRKQHVKLFGGEVKIQSSERVEVKKDEKYHHHRQNYQEYPNNISGNTVVKSTLQSGGTLVQTKPFEEPLKKSTSPEIIRVYESPPQSPTIDVVNVDKPSFSYRPEVIVDYPRHEETPYTYMNIMDYSQNAVKMLTPKIKQPTLNLQEIVSPLKINIEQRSFDKIDSPVFPKDLEERRKSENIDFAQKQILLQQKMTLEPPKLHVYNPVKFLVNGKVIRYVPGMPGPITVDTPLETPYSPSSPITRVPIPNMRLSKPNIRITPPESVEKYPEKHQSIEINRSPKMALEINTDLNPNVNEMKSPVKLFVIDKSPKLSENKSPIKSPNTPISLDSPKKFARPNSLAIKSALPGSLKQHHGLTPTVFNQILISPDTPRVAKKYNHQILHGNYFSYLGLKSSTKSSYCTLNKTQPFYVPHFKKLSMYSEWRQHAGTKMDKLFAGAYDSRQRNHKYTVAKAVVDDTILHSTYKFNVIEQQSQKEKEESNKSILGGFESNEDYTYIRGRGRGRYVCDQCGIRCKKPSMLKKHIRTHSNDRPYTCSHCNFSFKTKGNLTKHMKSKAHTKNYAATTGSTSVSPNLPGSPNSSDSESEEEDSVMDSSDESSTRNQEQQEREAVFGLLSLSQKSSVTESIKSSSNGTLTRSLPVDSSSNFMDTERIAHVTKTNYAKNKILDQSINFNAPKISDISVLNSDTDFREVQKITKYLGKTNLTRPLTYPYTTPIIIEPSIEMMETNQIRNQANSSELKPSSERLHSPKMVDPKQFSVISRYTKPETSNNHQDEEMPQNIASDLRKRKAYNESILPSKISRTEVDVIDLSMPSINGRKIDQMNGYHQMDIVDNNWKAKEIANNIIRSCEQPDNSPKTYESDERSSNEDSHQYNVNMNYVVMEKTQKYKQVEYDNSAMETLADIATKQEKLEKNSVAKNVASEFLKLATKNEQNENVRDAFIPNNKEVIVKPDENKNCNICMKTFTKPSQLRLHMNIHYLERPFRCDSCSVSFRTKGHLQKHERSASHHNKLSSSPNLSSSEPRPFKCSDCNIAFRIHGHLAKHLRAKMHIMKLECLNKIPFGLYAELERSNSLLTEINTADVDQCLESLKKLAQKVFTNDPGKLNHLGQTSETVVEADS